MNARKMLLRVAAALMVTVLPISMFAAEADALKAKAPAAAAPSAVGAWFGIARPCPADPAVDSPTHVALCQAVCGVCSSIPGTLPPEVPMMPTLLADGTVIADDAGEIGRYHTTAHGNWAPSSNDGLPDWNGLARFKATFFWLGSSADTTQKAGPANGSDPFGTCCFSNSVRPRFVTFFDPSDPDRMIGFIQPYASPVFVSPTTGLVQVQPFNPADPKAGNHLPLPTVDLIGGQLPSGCQNNLGCLGTYHFVIRRIKNQ